MNLKKPPMGWNSYDYYDTTVNEEQVRGNADYMAAHLKEYGWEYVVVDIAWYSYEAGEQRERFQYVPFCHVEMDEYSRLLPCVKRFPSSADGKGFGPLADYVHGLGLKFGIHIMRGIPRQAAYQRTKILGTDKTANEIADAYSICGWNPDMYGVTPGVEGAQEYYDSIVSLYADWGVDFIKCDDICRMDADSSKEEIKMLHRAIEKCGRDIVLSLSPGPALVEENEFYHENANMWRITDDLWDNWEEMDILFPDIVKAITSLAKKSYISITNLRNGVTWWSEKTMEYFGMQENYTIRGQRKSESGNGPVQEDTTNYRLHG